MLQFYDDLGLLGIVGNHEDAGTGTYLLQVGSDSRNLQFGIIARLDATFVQRDVQSGSKHLERRDMQLGMTHVLDVDDFRLLGLALKVDVDRFRRQPAACQSCHRMTAAARQIHRFHGHC